MDTGRVILMGPGKLEYAHTTDEQISIEDLYQGFLEYMNLAHALRATI